MFNGFQFFRPSYYLKFPQPFGFILNPLYFVIPNLLSRGTPHDDFAAVVRLTSTGGYQPIGLFRFNKCEGVIVRNALAHAMVWFGLMVCLAEASMEEHTALRFSGELGGVGHNLIRELRSAMGSDLGD